MKPLYIYATLSLFILSCQTENSTSETQEVATSPANTISSPPPLPDSLAVMHEEQSELRASEPKNLEEQYEVQNFTVVAPDPAVPDKVMQHAYIKMQVKDYETSSDSLKNYIAAFKAIITNAKAERINGNLENSLSIRVNNEKFNSLIQKLLQESVYLEYNKSWVKDVTEQYINEETRLKTKKKVEERYLALLAKARTVKEILAVEAELKTLQEDIEAAEASFNYLKNKVSYSTITLDYYQAIQPAIHPANTFQGKLSRAITDGWNGIIKFCLTIVALWPLLLTGIILGLWLLNYIRKRKLQAN